MNDLENAKRKLNNAERKNPSNSVVRNAILAALTCAAVSYAVTLLLITLLLKGQDSGVSPVFAAVTGGISGIIGVVHKHYKDIQKYKNIRKAQKEADRKKIEVAYAKRTVKKKQSPLSKPRRTL